MAFRKFSSAVELEICNRYLIAKSLEEVGTEFGCSQVTVRNILIRHGHKSKRVGGTSRLTSSQEDEIVNGYILGSSVEELKKQFHCSQPVVNRLLKSRGVVLRTKPRACGSKHGQWKGGCHTTEEGYVRVCVDREDAFAAMRDRTGYVLEHRLVMAKHLGRLLFPWETVHHKKEPKSNNDISNLQLRIGQHGKGVVLKCACCGSNNLIPDDL
jgi:Mor family transcriptional regulator